MARELAQSPPSGVSYSFVRPNEPNHRFITSPIKGYLGRYEPREVDLIEAVLSPISTTQPWVFSLAALPQATAFGLWGLPLPRKARIAFLERLFLRDNFKRLMFRSHAGKRTLYDYGGIDDERLLAKVEVVYPGIRAVPDELVRFQDANVTMLFTGDFFRKGGVNVIDAFERAQQRYPSIQLILCCGEKVDFNTPNESLRKQYLDKIDANPSIQSLGRVTRERLLEDLLPRADIFLIPTYVETFGFAILEAMAFGLPIISTNHFAIPEMIEHGVSGFLIDTERFDCDQLFRGYVVNELPRDFRDHVTEQVYGYLSRLIESVDLRRQIGLAALQVARTKFSADVRNRQLLEIYRQALD